MANILEMPITISSLKPGMSLRYIDDTLILCLYQKDIQTMLDHMNSIRSYILISVEKQVNSLAFLDVVTTHNVYCKPTFTGQYLNIDSHHP